MFSLDHSFIMFRCTHSVAIVLLVGLLSQEAATISSRSSIWEVWTPQGHNGLVRTIQMDNTKTITSGSYEYVIYILVRCCSNWPVVMIQNFYLMGRIFHVHRDHWWRIISYSENAKDHSLGFCEMPPEQPLFCRSNVF